MWGKKMECITLGKGTKKGENETSESYVAAERASAVARMLCTLFVGHIRVDGGSRY